MLTAWRMKPALSLSAKGSQASLNESGRLRTSSDNLAVVEVLSGTVLYTSGQERSVTSVDQVDPSSSRSEAEYMQALLRLRAAAGQPSLRELSRRADSATKGSLPVSTLSAAFKKGDLPPWRVVDALVKACGVAHGRMEKWRTTWEKITLAKVDEHGTVDHKITSNQDSSSETNESRTTHTRRRSKSRGVHVDQQNAEAEELVKWLRLTLIRPEKHKDESRIGVFEIDQLGSVDPGESRQFYSTKITAGIDVRCWASHPLLEFKTLYHCYAKGEDADALASAELPEIFRAKLTCLGQIRVIEMDVMPWDDEDRGVKYHTAYLVSEISGPD